MLFDDIFPFASVSVGLNVWFPTIEVAPPLVLSVVSDKSESFAVVKPLDVNESETVIVAPPIVPPVILEEEIDILANSVPLKNASPPEVSLKFFADIPPVSKLMARPELEKLDPSAVPVCVPPLIIPEVIFPPLMLVTFVLTCPAVINPETSGISVDEAYPVMTADFITTVPFA